MTAPPLLTYSEVAERLSVHVATVRRMVDAGELVAVKVGKRAVRFRPVDVEAFVASRRGDAEHGLSDGQLRAFQAKAGALARAMDVQKSQIKAAALAVTNQAHGISAESVSELSKEQASTALDWLEEQLEAHA